MDFSLPIHMVLGLIPAPYQHIVVSILSWMSILGVISSIIVAKLPMASTLKPFWGTVVRALHFLAASRFYDEEGSLKLPGQALRPRTVAIRSSQSGFATVEGMFTIAGAMVFAFALLSALAFCASGCHTQTTPSDGGVDWHPVVTIGLIGLDGTDQALIASEAATGLQGATLATYDGTLHMVHDAIGIALGHLANGASPCQIHADVTAIVDLVDVRLAQVFNANGLAVPSGVIDFVSRLAGVIASALPTCSADAGSNSALASRLTATYHLAH